MTLVMNCTRCLNQLRPEINNVEELNLQYLDIRVRLNTLNCENCRICIYMKFKNDSWLLVDSISRKEEAKHGWHVVKGADDLITFYILNQIIYNQTERHFDKGNPYFDFPDDNDLVKILWENGVPIGFYTAKRKASIVFDTMETYEMTTLDTAYIRKPFRRNGYGISILNDLTRTHQGEDIGISTPISTSMYYVVLKFLSHNPNYKTKLWEISGVGSEGNRKLLYFSVKKFINT